MPTWNEFAAAAPDLAAFGARRLLGRVSYLATLRSDGSPRVHPVTVHIGTDQLFVYMEPTSPKAHDLIRDSRYAIHCSVEDDEGGQGEFMMRGTARLVDDPKRRAALFEAARVAGFHPQDRHLVFEFGVEHALSTIYEDGKPKRKRYG